VGRQLLKLRRAGVIPHADVTDGTRWIIKPTTWDDAETMLAEVARSYRRRLWRDQAAEVRVFTEKDAISGIVLPVTQEWDVPLGVLRGYHSESFAWSVAQTIIESSKREIYLYQLGDHDPSGVDVWRAFRERVVAFLCERPARRLYGNQRDAGPRLPANVVTQKDLDQDGRHAIEYSILGGDLHSGNIRTVTFERLAVTPQQIIDWHLPSRPTKRDDTRSAKFIGDSVDVDAISAQRLRRLVEDAITRHIDTYALRVTRVAEESERELLYQLVLPRRP
jgi:hypothetical protein